MRTVFVSHNDLGLACLEELDRLGADIRAVLTRPNLDRISDQTDFTDFTAERDVPLHRVDSINTDAWVDRLGQYDPELLFVVGWSRLVEQRIASPGLIVLGDDLRQIRKRDDVVLLEPGQRRAPAPVRQRVKHRAQVTHITS